MCGIIYVHAYIHTCLYPGITQSWKNTAQNSSPFANQVKPTCIHDFFVAVIKYCGQHNLEKFIFPYHQFL